mmetsp:Transcript_28484/g.91990  ORF Transcript_28484/g.91990 Transcript_28484/m.91990 type:complete len:258 (+) Transcript_28484:805-1578(+)
MSRQNRGWGGMRVRAPRAAARGVRSIRPPLPLPPLAPPPRPPSCGCHIPFLWTPGCSRPPLRYTPSSAPPFGKRRLRRRQRRWCRTPGGGDVRGGGPGWSAVYCSSAVPKSTARGGQGRAAERPAYGASRRRRPSSRCWAAPRGTVSISAGGAVAPRPARVPVALIPEGSPTGAGVSPCSPSSCLWRGASTTPPPRASCSAAPPCAGLCRCCRCTCSASTSRHATTSTTPRLPRRVSRPRGGAAGLWRRFGRLCCAS